MEPFINIWPITISTYVSTMDLFLKNSEVVLIENEALEEAALLRPILNVPENNILITETNNYMKSLNNIIDLNGEYNKWLQINGGYFSDYRNSINWWRDFFYLLPVYLNDNKSFRQSYILSIFINKYINEYSDNISKDKKNIFSKFDVFAILDNNKEKIDYLYKKLSNYDKILYDYLRSFDEELFPYCIFYLSDGVKNQRFFKLLQDISQNYTKEEIQKLSNELKLFNQEFVTIHDEIKDDAIKSLEELFNFKLYEAFFSLDK